MKNIILIGFMGSGKSTIGNLFAKEYPYEFLDTDERMETIEKMSIPKIFSLKGEDYFRATETKIVNELLQNKVDSMIIATGGGLPMRENNQVLLKELGTIIYLKASHDTLVERLSKFPERRPMLNSTISLEEHIKILLENREPIYEELADYILHSGTETKEKIIKEIGEIVNE